jgi:hypothetical protein
VRSSGTGVQGGCPLVNIIKNNILLKKKGSGDSVPYILKISFKMGLRANALKFNKILYFF